MSDSGFIYRSESAIKALPGRAKAVTVPVDDLTVVMGMNAEVAQHYRIPDGGYTPHATTLDYIVGATAACLTGTLGGALEALGQTISSGELTAHATADIGLDGSVMVLRAIHVRYSLALSDGVAEAAAHKAHEGHAARCPVARSLGSAIDIRTELLIRESADHAAS